MLEELTHQKCVLDCVYNVLFYICVWIGFCSLTWQWVYVFEEFWTVIVLRLTWQWVYVLEEFWTVIVLRLTWQWVYVRRILNCDCPEIDLTMGLCVRRILNCDCPETDLTMGLCVRRILNCDCPEIDLTMGLYVRRILNCDCPEMILCSCWHVKSQFTNCCSRCIFVPPDSSHRWPWQLIIGQDDTSLPPSFPPLCYASLSKLQRIFQPLEVKSIWVSPKPPTRFFFPGLHSYQIFIPIIIWKPARIINACCVSVMKFSQDY